MTIHGNTVFAPGFGWPQLQALVYGTNIKNRRFKRKLKQIKYIRNW